MKKSAETLKSEMRQMIENLRSKFRRLLTENDQLPNDLRIPRDVRSTKGKEKRKISFLFYF